MILTGECTNLIIIIINLKAMRIESEAKLEQSRKEQEAEIEHTK